MFTSQTGKDSGSSLGEKETSKNSNNEPSLENIQEQDDEVIDIHLGKN